MSATPQPVIRQENWFSRHKRLAIGGLIAAAVILLFSFILCVIFLVFGLIRDSTVTHQALARAEANSAVAEQLGSPLKMGWLVTGTIDVSPGSGDADLTIPITGPKGQGDIHAVAKRAGGVWTFKELDVLIGSRTIDLLQPTPSPIRSRKTILSS
jgi:hypothetical protein